MTEEQKILSFMGKYCNEITILYEDQKEQKKEFGYCNSGVRVEDTDVFTSQIHYLLAIDDNSNLMRKMALLELFKSGYQNIRSINKKIGFKSEFDSDDIGFINVLNKAECFNVLEIIYEEDELNYIKDQINKHK